VFDRLDDQAKNSLSAIVPKIPCPIFPPSPAFPLLSVLDRWLVRPPVWRGARAAGTSSGGRLRFLEGRNRLEQFHAELLVDPLRASLMKPTIVATAYLGGIDSSMWT
jgi:hypothetical protein